VLYSPHYLKTNYTLEMLKEFGVKLDINVFRRKYNALFWNSIWYFSLKQLVFDFVLPYKEDIEHDEYLKIIEQMSGDNFFTNTIKKSKQQQNNNNNINSTINYTDNNIKIFNDNNLEIESSIINFTIEGRLKSNATTNKIIYDNISESNSDHRSVGSFINPNTFNDNISSININLEENLHSRPIGRRHLTVFGGKILENTGSNNINPGRRRVTDRTFNNKSSDFKNMKREVLENILENNGTNDDEEEIDNNNNNVEVNRSGNNKE
jgi:hypothetical protein